MKMKGQITAPLWAWIAGAVVAVAAVSGVVFGLTWASTGLADMDKSTPVSSVTAIANLEAAVRYYETNCPDLDAPEQCLAQPEAMNRAVRAIDKLHGGQSEELDANIRSFDAWYRDWDSNECRNWANRTGSCSTIEYVTATAAATVASTARNR